MSTLQKTKRNMISSILSSVILIAMGIVVPRITMVGYGSEVNGLLSSVTQFITYLTLFEAGIQAVATKAMYQVIGQNSKDTDGINGVLAAVHKNYKKVGGLYFFGLLCLSLIYPVIARSETIDYFTVFCVVFFSGLGNVILFFYQGKYKILLCAQGKSYLFTTVNTVISILNHAVKIALLLLGCNVAIVIAAAFVVSLGQALFVYVYMKRNRQYRWVNLKVTPNNEALQQNKQALVHQISSLVFSNTDVLLLTIFCDLKVVSVYSIYKFVVSNIASFLMIPLSSCEFALGQQYHRDKKVFTQQMDTLEVVYGSLVFAVFTVTLCLYTPFIKLYTASVTDINYIDPVIALLFVLSELLTFMRYPMLRVISFAGHFKQTLSRTITETAINLTVSIVGVIFFGIYGVLFGTVVALMYRTFDIIIYSNKVLLERTPGKTLGIYAINAVLFVAVSVALYFVNLNIANYVVFCLAGAALLLALLGVYFGVNLLVHKQEYTYVKSIIRNKMGKEGNEL